MPSAAVAADVGPKFGLVAAPLIQIPEAATQTFKKGALIAINAAGFAVEAATPNPVNIVGVAVNPGQNLTSAGVPNSAAPGNVTGNCAVIPAIPHVQIEANLDQSTALGYALLAADMYAQYGWVKDATTGIWYIDKAAVGGAARVTIVGFKDAVGKAAARVYAVFKSTATIYS